MRSVRLSSVRGDGGRGAAEARRSREGFAAAERRGEAALATARRQVQDAERALTRAQRGGAAGPPGFGTRGRTRDGSSAAREAEQALARARANLQRVEDDVSQAIDDAEWEAGSNEREARRCEGWAAVSRIVPEDLTAVLCTQRSGIDGDVQRGCSPFRFEAGDSEDANPENELFFDSYQAGLLRGASTLRGEMWRDDFDRDGEQELVAILVYSRPAAAYVYDRSGGRRIL